jgi:hypothetical protein
MKAIKIYLVVVTVLLVVAIGFGVYVWYALQKLDGDIESAVGVESSLDAGAEGEKGKTPALQTVTEPIVVDTASLTESQQGILKTFGYKGDTFTITEAMIVCAKDAVGEVRFTEILDGAAPSPLESVKLLPCMKK